MLKKLSNYSHLCAQLRGIFIVLQMVRKLNINHIIIEIDREEVFNLFIRQPISSYPHQLVARINQLYAKNLIVQFSYIPHSINICSNHITSLIYQLL